MALRLNNWQQNNASDLRSFKTKNINFDEEGYLKLSPRTVSLISTDDDADFNLPVAFGRRNSGQFYVATADAPFEIQIDANAANGINAEEDDDTGGDTPPNGSFTSHGCWFNNLWHKTEDDELFSKNPSNGNWTDRDKGGDMTAGVLHPLCHHISRNTLVVGNGNQVLQYDTGYSADTTLTISALFEVTKIAFNNGKLGIATKLADTVSGINGNAQFFVWDGTTTAAPPGIDAGSDYIMDVAPYRGTFAILNRIGQLRMWNGGGWTELGQLPVWFTSRTWGDSVNAEGLGDILKVDGDIIYINVNSKSERFGARGEEYVAPGGVWCYDPRIGLYHRTSPSISLASRLTVTSGNVNTSTNILTKTAGTVSSTGSPVKYIDDPGDEIGGLTIGKVYFCIKLSSNTFQLAETREKALNGIAIDLTSQSGSTSYFLTIELQDYGQSYMQRTGAIELQSDTDLVRNQFVLGAELQDYDATTDREHICFDVLGFKNIGYVITPKVTSQQIKDYWQKSFAKHRRLKDGERIIVKDKTADLVGVPVTTPQHGQHCTWSGTNELYTSANLAEAKSYLDLGGERELECEIISGAGAGQMSQVKSIAYDSGVYSIVLADEIEGVVASNICDIRIENWRLVKTITTTDTEHIEAPTYKSGEHVSLKVIMEGDEVALYDILVANNTQKPIA